MILVAKWSLFSSTVTYNIIGYAVPPATAVKVWFKAVKVDFLAWSKGSRHPLVIQFMVKTTTWKFN